MGSPSLVTADRAVTTEAPRWRYSRRGGIPEGARGSFNEAATDALFASESQSFLHKFLSFFVGRPHRGTLLHAVRPAKVLMAHPRCNQNENSPSQKPLKQNFAHYHGMGHSSSTSSSSAWSGVPGCSACHLRISSLASRLLISGLRSTISQRPGCVARILAELKNRARGRFLGHARQTSR